MLIGTVGFGFVERSACDLSNLRTTLGQPFLRSGSGSTQLMGKDKFFSGPTACLIYSPCIIFVVGDLGFFLVLSD